MGFSDDDLLILKANRRYWEARTQSEPNHLVGLIHRLECAEKLLPAWQQQNGEPYTRKLWLEAEKAWQASKGDGGKE